MKTKERIFKQTETCSERTHSFMLSVRLELAEGQRRATREI